MDARVICELLRVMRGTRGLNVETRHSVLARNVRFRMETRCMDSSVCFGAERGFKPKRGNPVPRLTMRLLNFSLLEQSTQLHCLTMDTDYKGMVGVA